MTQPETCTAKWTPSPELTDHAGNPLAQDLLFWTEPPAEIGPVISAYSTAHQGQPLRAFPLLILLGGAAVLGLLINILVGARPVYAAPWLFVLPLVALYVAFKLDRVIERHFPHSFEATFVGERGWARESLDIHSKTQKTQLQFGPHLTLFNDSSYSYERGRCRGLHFDLRWLLRNGEEAGRIDERSWSGDRIAPDAYGLHFALAAERSWARTIEAGVVAETQHGGSAVFAIKTSPSGGRGALRLSAQGIDVRYGEVAMRLNFSEMEPVSVFHEAFGTGKKDECLMLRKKGVAKHQWGVTTLTVPFGEIANVRLLLDLLERKIGRQ